MTNPNPQSSILTSSSAIDAGQLIKDFEVLCDGPSIEVHLAFDGVVLAMRSMDKLVLEKAAEQAWMRLEAKDRVKVLAGWLHEAAEKYCALLEKRTHPESRKKGVA